MGQTYQVYSPVWKDRDEPAKRQCLGSSIVGSADRPAYTCALPRKNATSYADAPGVGAHAKRRGAPRGFGAASLVGFGAWLGATVSNEGSGVSADRFELSELDPPVEHERSDHDQTRRTGHHEARLPSREWDHTVLEIHDLLGECEEPLRRLTVLVRAPRQLVTDVRTW